MRLKELEYLTKELAELARLLREETRIPARVIIIQRAQEIMTKIGEGAKR